MTRSHPIYLASVCLERNRWGSKQPSFRVSEWLERIAADGFDGLELWENHYLLAEAEERDRLERSAGAAAVFNTYAGFSDSPSDLEHRLRAAEAIARLGTGAVKFNLGREPARLGEYRRHLLSWADQLPPHCRLLCECHPGSVLETCEAASDFLSELDPERFGVIVHLSGDADGPGRWLTAFGPRVRHLHLQCRKPEDASAEGRARLAAGVALLANHGFDGSASVEFTRGIGRDENIHALYAHALSDLRAYSQAWN